MSICLWTVFIILTLDLYKMYFLFKLDFWKVPHLNTSVDIHVPIHVYNDVTKHLSRVGLHPTLLINDLQRCVYGISICTQMSKKKRFFFKYIIRSYHNHLDIIVIWLIFERFHVELCNWHLIINCHVNIHDNIISQKINIILQYVFCLASHWLIVICDTKYCIALHKSEIGERRDL